MEFKNLRYDFENHIFLTHTIRYGYNYDMKAFECQYEIGYEMVNGAGLVKPRTIMELFMESAIRNCLDAGYSVFDMLRDGLGWVLRGGNFLVRRFPEYAEKVRISTWISKWTPFQGFREFIMFDQLGDELARCSSVWAIIDLVRRLPSKICEVFKARWPFNESTATDGAFCKRPLQTPDLLLRKDISVMRHDIDTNGHAHSLSYLDWVFESLPESHLERRMKSISGSFFREVANVDQVRCVVSQPSPDVLIHNIVSLDERTVYATGTTTWEPSLTRDVGI